MVKPPVNSTWPLPKEHKPDIAARNRALAKAFLGALDGAYPISLDGAEAYLRLRERAK